MRYLLPVFLIFLTAASTLATGSAERKSSVNTTVNQLEAKFSILTPTISATDDFAAQVVFTNKSSKDLRLNALFLDMPNVLLKVRRAGGGLVHPGPPGMPPPDDGEVGRQVLKPGESITYKYTGAEYFGTQLAPGNYQVRFRYENSLSQHGDWTGTIETDWLTFEVTNRAATKQ